MAPPTIHDPPPEHMSQAFPDDWLMQTYQEVGRYTTVVSIGSGVLAEFSAASLGLTGPVLTSLTLCTTGSVLISRTWPKVRFLIKNPLVWASCDSTKLHQNYTKTIPKLYHQHYTGSQAPHSVPLPPTGQRELPRRNERSDLRNRRDAQLERGWRAQYGRPRAEP